MRAHAALALVALLLAAPSALAAGFTLGADRAMDASVDAATGDASFDMPVAVDQDGALYAKILPTDANAAYNGTATNGSWSVTFALAMPDGSRVDLGTFHDSTSTQLVPVRAGDAVRLLARVHAPADAASVGGAQQTVYVAIAYRAGGSTGGSWSGATQDEARALVLRLHFATASGAVPPVATTLESSATPPVSAIQVATPPTSGAAGATTLVQQSAPAWFYVAVALGLILVAAALAAVAVALFLLRRRSAAPPERVVPVRVDVPLRAETPSAEQAATPRIERPRDESG